LRKNSDIDLADVAYTLQIGRRAFDHRRMVVAKNAADAATALAVNDVKRVFSRSSRNAEPKVGFLFPGQGAQQPNMARRLYDTEEMFRNEVDRCCELLKPLLQFDLRDVLYPAGEITDEIRQKLTQTALAQPAIFTVEYALVRLWMSWGIEPAAMIGHSIGEFAVACVAGVFSLEDALRLVAARGCLMQSLPRGSMLSIRASETDVRAMLGPDLSIAAMNAPMLCVVSGPDEAVAALEAELTRKEIIHRRLHTSHAFHSAMMDPIHEQFAAEVGKIRLHAPMRAYVSGLTGKWITPAQATDPAYWVRHMREPVQFSRGVENLRQREDLLLLEVGPGNVLATLARQHPAKAKDQILVSSLTDGTPDCNEMVAMEQALGALWLGGVQPDWKAFHAGARRLRVALPTYPFERKRYWLEVPKNESAAGPQSFGTTSQTPQIFESPSTLPVQEIPIMTQASVSNTQSRQDKIRGMLAGIFEDLSGVDVSAAEPSATFLELGFDSLFLTQVTQSIQSTFGLKVTFRQLLSDQNSLAALSAYIDSKLPADKFAVDVTSPQAVASPAASQTAPVAMPSAPGAAGTVEQLMRDQLLAMNQLFAQQLAALNGTAASNATLTVPTAAPAQKVAPPVPAASAEPAVGSKEPEAIKELKGFSPFKPVQKSISGELTQQQERYIRDLSERYTRKTAGSKAKTQEYRGVLADPRVASGFRLQWKEMVYPIVSVRSQGSRLWDVDGNEYIDLLNGFGPIMLGHRPEFVEKAIARQLHEGFEIGPQTLLAGEAAKLICELTGNERATFCNTGSEAVIAAMRIARTVTGRNKVVFFAGDYHGMFDEVLMKGIKRAGEPQSIPVAPGIPREAAANVVVLEYGADESMEWIRKHASELAAVMVEPVQSRHPNLQPIAFLKELRKITEESETCLIFDEVVTGFRTHPGGCQALFDIRADLATYGKVLAGGMPIGVLAGKSQYMDALDGGMWEYGDDSYPQVGVTFFAGTFVRHPLAMAACTAVLTYLKEQGPQLQQSLNERAGKFVQRLNSLLEKNQVPTHIENFSSYFYFSFPGDFRFSSLFYFHLREKGVHILEGFPCFLTTVHTDADLDYVVRAFEETIAEMQAGGVLPQPGVDSQPTLAVASGSSAPLTEPQREIFLAAKLDESASCAFNESFSLHLRGVMRPEVLRDSVNLLIARHEALRATIAADGNMLDFHPALALQIPLRDLSGLPSQERDAEFKRLVDALRRSTMHLYLHRITSSATAGPPRFWLTTWARSTKRS
jgi:acyl transferase domain-containing protein